MLSKMILKVAQAAMNKYTRLLKNPMSSQKKVLREFLQANKNTNFGYAHKFSKIKTLSSYQELVPIADFKDISHYIDFAHKYDNVLSSEPIIHWIQTTGTTGTPKTIPMTSTALKKWSDGSSRQFYAYILDSPGNEKVIDGKIFAYAGPAVMDRIRGIPLGYISGATCTRVKNPVLLKRIVPSPEIVNIKDWRERMWQFMMNTINQDVRVITGIPPVILGFLRAIQTNLPFQVDQISDPKTQLRVQNAIFADTIDFEMLWPNLDYFASSGVIAEPYKPLIYDLLGDITILEMYAASEGHFGFQMHEDEPGFYLNFDKYLFEFKDLEDPSQVLLLDEVKKDHPYEMIISSITGLYRYNMHDVVRFLSIDPPKLMIQGRAGNFMNIGNEKVSEDQLALALGEALKTIQGSHVDYILSGTIAMPLRHKIYIELSKHLNNSEQKIASLSEIYDELMQKLNTCYLISRGQEALTPPEIHILKKGSFREISKRKAKEKNQIEHTKVLHIVQPDKLKKLIDEEMVEYSYIPSD